MIYDCIIIGKGPAGVSAGLYIKRGNFNVLIIGKDNSSLEKAKEIDNYYGFKDIISGSELLSNGIKQAQRIGIEIETDEVIGVNFDSIYNVKTRNNIFKSKSLIIATGSNRKTPKIKGIDKFEGNGVSYCAVCDAFFYKEKDVSVLGSGDYALEEASNLLTVAKSVSILTNGEAMVQNRNMNYDKFKFEGKEIQEIMGNNKLSEIKFKDGSKLKTDGLFIAIGVASSIDLARKLGVIINNGNISVDKNMATNVPGVYACGDCTGGVLQISKAVYEGMIAGLGVIDYLRKNK